MAIKQKSYGHDADTGFEIYELRNEAGKLLKRLHKVAVREALAKAFPELYYNNVLVYVNENDIDFQLSNLEIISKVLSQDKVKRVSISDAIDKYKKSALKKLKIHPLVLDIVFRSNSHSNIMDVSVKTLNSMFWNLLANANFATPIFSIQIGGNSGNDIKTQTELNMSMRKFQTVLINGFTETLLKKVKKHSNKVVLITYDPTIDFYVMKVLTDKIMMSGLKSIYAYIDKAVLLGRDIVDLLSSNRTLILVTDSLTRFRELVSTYLRTLKSQCDNYLESSLLRRLLSSNRVKVVEEIGRLLDIVIKHKLDSSLIHAILTYIDTSPGVLFKVLNTVITDLYIELKKTLDFPNITDTAKLEYTIHKLILRSVRSIADKYTLYTAETLENIYDHYMNILEKMVDIYRDKIAYVMHTLSIYAELQLQYEKTLLISEASLAKHVLIEPVDIPSTIPKVVDGLKKLGFVDVIDYMGSRIIVILRPLLLKTYSNYIEKEFPMLMHLRYAKIEDIKPVFKPVNTEPETLSILSNVFGKDFLENTTEILEKVLIDENIYEELRKPIKMTFYVQKSQQS